MYALAFDLDCKATALAHPSGYPQPAYADIRTLLVARGFKWTQGSLYILDVEDMSILFGAIQALMQLQWFPASVRDIRAFRVEQWSDFTATVKGTAGSTGGSPKA